MMMSVEIVTLRDENFALKQENLELLAKEKISVESNGVLKASMESRLNKLQAEYEKQNQNMKKLQGIAKRLRKKLITTREGNQDCWDKIDSLKSENRQLESQFETDMTSLMEKLQKQRSDTDHHKRMFEDVTKELKQVTKRLVDEKDQNKNLQIQLTSERNRVASFMVIKDYREFKELKEFSMEYPSLANSKQRGQLIICGGRCEDCVSGRHFFIKLLSS